LTVALRAVDTLGVRGRSGLIGIMLGCSDDDERLIGDISIDFITGILSFDDEILSALLTNVLDRFSVNAGIVSLGGAGGSRGEISDLLVNVSDRLIVADGTLSTVGGEKPSFCFSNVPDRFLAADGTLSIGLMFEILLINGGVGLSVFFSNVSDRFIGVGRSSVIWNCSVVDVLSFVGSNSL
jgi:hypothetical protein